MTRSRTALSAAVLAAALSGCSSQATVKGTVRFDGQPVENGGITFIPAGAGGQKAGAEIRNGTYEIPRDRAPAPGKYKVEVTWNKKTGKQVTVPGDPGNKIDETQQAIDFVGRDVETPRVSHWHGWTTLREEVRQVLVDCLNLAPVLRSIQFQSDL